MTERTKEDRRAAAERRLTEIAESTPPLTVSTLAAPGCMLQTRPVYYTPDPWKPDERYEIATLFRCSHTQGVGELAWGHREAWPHLRPQDHAVISLVLDDLDGEGCWSALPVSVGPHVTLGDVVECKAKEE